MHLIFYAVRISLRFFVQLYTDSFSYIVNLCGIRIKYEDKWIKKYNPAAYFWWVNILKYMKLFLYDKAIKIFIIVE